MRYGAICLGQTRNARQSTMKPFIAITITSIWCLAFTGCKTADKPEATASNIPLSPNYSTDGNGVVPAMPVDYQNQIAIKLVSEYNIESSGPPEISEIHTIKAALGTTTQVIARYPVNLNAVTRGSLLFASNKETYYRCAAMQAHKGISTFGSITLSVVSEKHPKTNCGESFQFRPFKELVDLAAECRKTNGVCEISRKYPNRNFTVGAR